MDSKITYWGTADLIAGNGPQRGYFVNEHSDGDRDFGTFEGRIATSDGQVTLRAPGNLPAARESSRVLPVAAATRAG